MPLNVAGACPVVDRRKNSKQSDTSHTGSSLKTLNNVPEKGILKYNRTSPLPPAKACSQPSPCSVVQQRSYD
jgi:hypothetical protein